MWIKVKFITVILVNLFYLFTICYHGSQCYEGYFVMLYEGYLVGYVMRVNVACYEGYVSMLWELFWYVMMVKRPLIPLPEETVRELPSDPPSSNSNVGELFVSRPAIMRDRISGCEFSSNFPRSAPYKIKYEINTVHSTSDSVICRLDTLHKFYLFFYWLCRLIIF